MPLTLSRPLSLALSLRLALQLRLILAEAEKKEGLFQVVSVVSGFCCAAKLLHTHMLCMRVCVCVCIGWLGRIGWCAYLLGNLSCRSREAVRS